MNSTLPSKREIDQAGITLAKTTHDRIPGYGVDPDEYQNAVDKLALWRESHQPLLVQTFGEAVIASENSFGAVVASRFKRLPSIVTKLKRYPNLKLSKLQDIVGVRIILENIQQLRNVQGILLSKDNLVLHNDYIYCPKASGYRGVHLIYKADDGKKIEVQLRTKQQHIWATALEATGRALGIDDDIKVGKYPDDWGQYFALISSVFARMEECPSAHPNLLRAQLFEAIARWEAKLGLLNCFDNIQPPRVCLEGEPEGCYHDMTSCYHDERRELTVVDHSYFSFDDIAWQVHRLDGYVTGSHFSQQNVLLFMKKEDVRAAYPNYFLDVEPFLSQLRAIVQGSTPALIY
jgi:putative GTP pyrophosphokinase